MNFKSGELNLSECYIHQRITILQIPQKQIQLKLKKKLLLHIKEVFFKKLQNGTMTVIALFVAASP